MATTFRLAAILAKRELTQVELSRRAGVGLRTVARLCRNSTRQVSLDTLDAIATALGIHPGELLEQDGAKRRKAR